MNELALDATATAELIVSESDLASALPLIATDAFPAVFATARMVALMEIASARLMQSCLKPGELSVGVGITAIHSAPTPVGAKVIATARFAGREGKLFLFEVIASDAAGEIGRATHKRAIVDVQRLQSTAVRRIAGAA